jgi:transcriptional regulator with XRE-family HTH domain
MRPRRDRDRLLDGRHLRAARESAGLKQEQLAAAAGLHANSLRYWERHATDPYGFAVDRLLAALQARGVSVSVNLNTYGCTAVIERRQAVKRSLSFGDSFPGRQWLSIDRIGPI